MKRFAILTALMVCIIITRVQAQTEAFHPLTINPGIGSGGIYYNGLTNNAHTASPSLSIDYMIKPKLGIGQLAVGLVGSYAKVKYPYFISIPPNNTSIENTKTPPYTSILLGIRVTYHFIIPIKGLDPYAGILGIMPR